VSVDTELYNLARAVAAVEVHKYNKLHFTRKNDQRQPFQVLNLKLSEKVLPFLKPFRRILCTELSEFRYNCLF
jgi:hypothetical protein